MSYPFYCLFCQGMIHCICIRRALFNLNCTYLIVLCLYRSSRWWIDMWRTFRHSNDGDYIHCHLINYIEPMAVLLNCHLLMIELPGGKNVKNWNLWQEMGRLGWTWISVGTTTQRFHFCSVNWKVFARIDEGLHAKCKCMAGIKHSNDPLFCSPWHRFKNRNNTISLCAKRKKKARTDRTGRTSAQW